jgi:LacI family transcriptional regulator
MVGLVIPDLMHSFFAEVAKGASKKLEPLGYQIVIFDSEEDAEAEQRQLQALMARGLDGLIVASTQTNGRAGVFAKLGKASLPYVLIDRMLPSVNAHFVGVRDEEVGFLATEHLITEGCRRLAHIRGPALSVGTGRLRGFRRALAKHRIATRPECVVGGFPTDASGYESMSRLLNLTPRPDGVFCYNDPVAAGAMKAVLESGFRIPEDVAIVGAGNVHYSHLLRIPLSTVDQGSSAIGEKAAELLVRCMEQKPPLHPERIFIPPRLIVRESSRKSDSRVRTVR